MGKFCTYCNTGLQRGHPTLTSTAWDAKLKEEAFAATFRKKEYPALPLQVVVLCRFVVLVVAAGSIAVFVMFSELIVCASPTCCCLLIRYL